MTDAIRDNNHVTVALGVSSTDATVTLPFKVDPSTGRLLTDASGSGYTNLTQFVDQTPWRIFYSNGSGDVTELAFGASGTVLQSNGASAAPTWATAGAGDVVKVGTPVNNQVGVWTGDGTIEGDAALTFDTATDTLTTGIVNSTSLTVSEIVITDASKNLISAAVATYPSLTELTYVKGVTSAIQTQINSKQATITFGTGVQAALGVNVGTAGSIVVNGGALGTPSSGTVTNLTGTASININGTVGATTPTTGAFTTGTFSTSATIATSDTSTTPRLEVTQGSTGDAAMRFALSTTRSYAFGIDNSASDSLSISTAASASAALGTGDIFTLTTAGALTITGAFSVGTSNSITAGTIELGAASDTTLSRSAAGVLAVEGVVIPSISSTNTLTNKRITKRVGTTTSSATPTINTDNVDYYSLTAQTVDITSFTTNLSGTPTDAQTLWISITGTAARAITWGTSFEASTVALPTTTVSTNRLDVGFVWNAATSKWRCIASA